MKICHLTTVHPYNDPRIYHKECVGLAKSGYDVFLVTTHHENIFQNNIKMLGVGKPKNRWHRIFFSIPKVFLQGLKTKAKIFHLHDPELLILAPVLRILGKQVIYDIHEDMVTSITYKEYLPKFLARQAANFFGYIERAFSKFCYLIIAEKYYIERFPKSVAVLNYPQSINVNEQNPIQIELSKLDRNYNWFFYSGNISEQRGALQSIQMLAAVKTAAIFMIGKCTSALYQKMQHELAKHQIDQNRVVVVGVDQYIPKQTIDYALFNGPWVAGLALFPPNPHYFRKELTKFFEYIQAELPILASDFPDWKNMIEGQGLGKTCDVEDQHKLTNALEEILHRENFTQSLVAAKAKYNWDSQAKILIEFYNNIISKIA